MSIYPFPQSLCLELEKMMNSSWWGDRGINWLRWKNLVVNSEKLWQVGFKNIQDFNLAMLSKQA
uniref:Uncharacterized protein n=1 Tax=Cajanus cajan TaxID=3821 RepID=A0A151RKF7_CAJCA|nr:hypothetical protein KK1_035535 [Cajanus cajan]